MFIQFKKSVEQKVEMQEKKKSFSFENLIQNFTKILMIAQRSIKSEELLCNDLLRQIVDWKMFVIKGGLYVFAPRSRRNAFSI